MCRGVQKSFRRVKISNSPLYQSRNFWSLNLLKLLNVWYSSRLSLFYQSTSTTPPHQSLILTFLLLEQLLSLQCLVAFFGIIAPFLLLLPVWGAFWREESAKAYILCMRKKTTLQSTQFLWKTLSTTSIPLGKERYSSVLNLQPRG